MPYGYDFSQSSKQCKYISSDKMDTFFQVLSHCAWRQIMQINGVYFLFRLGPLLYFVISGYFQKKIPDRILARFFGIIIFRWFERRKSSIISAINGHVVAGRFWPLRPHPFTDIKFVVCTPPNKITLWDEKRKRKIAPHTYMYEYSLHSYYIQYLLTSHN